MTERLGPVGEQLSPAGGQRAAVVERLAPRQRRTWAGYAAAIWAGLFGLVSLYWALGGLFAIDTVGGRIEELARARDPQAYLLGWGATAGKAAGVLLALALVQHWGRIVPRVLLLIAGWAATVLLIGYGGLTVGAEALVALHVLHLSSGVDTYAFYWHLALWDPYFLVWGILFGLAVRQFQAATRPDESP